MMAILDFRFWIDRSDGSDCPAFTTSLFKLDFGSSPGAVAAAIQNPKSKIQNHLGV
jgi:hypothetical protein